MRWVTGSAQVEDLLDDTLLVLDLLLQKHDAVNELLRPRRAPGDIYIHRNHLVHRNQRVVIEHAGRGGTRAHGDHPLGLRHLLIEPADHRGILLETRPAMIMKSDWRGDPRMTS